MNTQFITKQRVSTTSVSKEVLLESNTYNPLIKNKYSNLQKQSLGVKNCEL